MEATSPPAAVRVCQCGHLPDRSCSPSKETIRAIAFAAPSQVQVAAGPAGQSVVQTIAVPSGAAVTSSAFNGQFTAWFADGGRFLTTAGSTVLVYSNVAVQQGSFAFPISSGATTIGGEGNWVWVASSFGALSVYPATGTNPAAAATYSLGVLATVVAAGPTLAAFTSNTTVSVIDLSGATPVRTDYTSPISVAPQAATPRSPYAAVSASQWLVGGADGVLLDGASLASTPRFFGFGAAMSIAGGTGHFAIATAIGKILYFNSATLAQEGQIDFLGSQLMLSTDGSVLLAQGTSALQDYTLPAGGAPLYSWSSTGLAAFALSAPGTVLEQLLGNTLQASSPTGGSLIFSAQVPTSNILTISPAGTFTALANGSFGLQTTIPGTSLFQNGTLVTAFNGLPVGWLDDSRLVVDNYALLGGLVPTYTYSGCTLYGPNGSPTGGACALGQELRQFQPVGSDTLYSPANNQILSVSTGAVTWASGDLGGSEFPIGAVAGAYVVFISGTSIVAQSH